MNRLFASILRWLPIEPFLKMGLIIFAFAFFIRGGDVSASEWLVTPEGGAGKPIVTEKQAEPQSAPNPNVATSSAVFTPVQTVDYKPPDQAKPLNKKTFFSRIEYWSAGKAYEKDDEALSDAVVLFSRSYPGVFSGKSNVEAGAGFRVGMFVPLDRRGFEGGGSVGYIKGPQGRFTLDHRISSFDWEREEFTYQTTFIRILSEVQKRVSLTRALELRLRGGGGVAHGMIEGEAAYIARGSYNASGRASIKKKWTGVTWEISPSIAFRGESAGLELGIIYGTFPVRKEDEYLYEFKWESLGLYTSVEF